jgi:hypothetical protein
VDKWITTSKNVATSMALRGFCIQSHHTEGWQVFAESREEITRILSLGLAEPRESSIWER